MNKRKGKGDPKRTRKSYNGQAPIVGGSGWIRDEAIKLPTREILRRQREQGGSKK